MSHAELGDALDDVWRRRRPVCRGRPARVASTVKGEADGEDQQQEASEALVGHRLDGAALVGLIVATRRDLLREQADDHVQNTLRCEADAADDFDPPQRRPVEPQP